MPTAKLDAHTRALAADVAKTPANHLSILKAATNRFDENMGLFGSWQAAGELDAIFHQSPAYIAFFKLAKAEGMKAAVEKRKQVYG